MLEEWNFQAAIFPAFTDRSMSRIESEGARTSRISVFIVPPRNVLFEIG